MIDTDKYEGHTSGSKSELHPSGWWVEWVDPCTWYIRDPEVHLVGSEANRLLIQDAPLLLEEVKRLREAMKTMLDDMSNASPEEDIEYWLDTWKHWLKEMIE